MAFNHLPTQCRKGSCDHEPGRCTRYRSRRCLSGECTHWTQNLHCGEVPAPARAEAATQTSKAGQ